MSAVPQPVGASIRSPSRSRTLTILGISALLFSLLHMGVGSTIWYTPWQVIQAILNGPGREDTLHTVVWQIRMPRSICCVLVGGILGLVGAAFQAQLRNPLADPYIVGVSSGAAVGGALAVVGGVAGFFGGLGMTLAGFVTGMASLALVVSLSQRRGVLHVSSLLLAGVVVGTLLSAVLSLILLLSGRDQSVVLNWLLGSTTPAFWPENAVLAVAFGVGAILLNREARRMNAFALGEETAQRLGVNTVKLTRTVLLVGTALTAATVGAVGIIGFVGLVAPHVARRLLGVDWRYSMPGAVLVGMALLPTADLLAQRGMSLLNNQVGFDLPVGIVTALLGAPSLLILMRRER